MARPESEKKLVNAIVDGENGAKALAAKASQQGKALGARLTQITRAIVAARQAGMLTPQQAKDKFREAYIGLVLAGYVAVAQEIADHSSQVAADIKTHAKAAGSAVRQMAPIRKADVLAREIEKKQATNGG